MTETTKTILSAHTRAAIDRWLTRYPAEQKRSGVLQALTIVQEENGGWLSQELMDAVADYLEMSCIAVYEVVSFYTMYNLKPTGRHVINVCTNISCMLSGSEKIVEHLKKRLEIEINETTTDGKFTLREVECLAACAAAPMFQIGKTYYENLTPEKVDAIIKELE
ncbi:MAG: NADH dehydrogenase (Ubiquinone), 24 kDa subunit [uncultured bacterium]|nr:MAG: NADH dehydrogenase (Ubiquinone), 24 kDa subunit [uncultured bacterium]